MIAWLNCEFAYALTLVFSLKKSFFKAAYSLVQCYFDFTAVEVKP